MCGATVQSIANVNALSTRRFNSETKEEEVSSVIETRVTGLMVHTLIGCSLLLLPLLSRMPTPIGEAKQERWGGGWMVQL